MLMSEPLHFLISGSLPSHCTLEMKITKWKKIEWHNILIHSLDTKLLFPWGKWNICDEAQF